MNPFRTKDNMETVITMNQEEVKQACRDWLEKQGQIPHHTLEEEAFQLHVWETNPNEYEVSAEMTIVQKIL